MSNKDIKIDKAVVVSQPALQLSPRVFSEGSKVFSTLQPAAENSHIVLPRIYMHEISKYFLSTENQEQSPHAALTTDQRG